MPRRHRAGAEPPPGWTIGIDIGGTKTALCIAAFPEARLLHRTTIATPAGAASGMPFLGTLCRRAATLLRRSGRDGPCRGIGISICETVDLEGAVTSSHRVRWSGLPVRERFAALVPTVVESDVRAAALAEARFGAGRAYGDFLYLNVGTGISTCWVKDGRPHAGARGNALALASSPLSFTCPHCGKASSYVLEDVAGGAGLAACHAALGGRRVGSAKAVLQAAARGDRLAQQAIAQATHALGMSLGLAINVIDPQAVVVGGGLGAAEGPYWRRLVRETRKHVWSEATRTLPLRRATLGGDSALIGAAACAWLAART
jgi:glucokinase